MCLRTQGIVENGYVGRVRRACGLSDDDGCVGRGRGIEDASDGLETTTKAAMIQGKLRRLRRCNDAPEELVTTTEALEEKDEPKDSMTTTDASAEEAE